MVTEYKGKRLSNSLMFYSYYKQYRGTSAERDMTLLADASEKIKDPKIPVEEKARILDKAETVEIVVAIYYALRCAAEGKSLDVAEVVEEIDVQDLTRPEFQETIKKLFDAEIDKKKGRFPHHGR